MANFLSTYFVREVTITVWLVSSLTGLDFIKQEIFVIECKPVKLPLR